ncbi:hypothetical protein ACLJJ6_00390 [Pediococcus siamensis]
MKKRLRAGSSNTKMSKFFLLLQIANAAWILLSLLKRLRKA